jgi:hypothetical protein
MARRASGYHVDTRCNARIHAGLRRIAHGVSPMFVFAKMEK